MSQSQQEKLQTFTDTSTSNVQISTPWKLSYTVIERTFFCDTMLGNREKKVEFIIKAITDSDRDRWRQCMSIFKGWERRESKIERRNLRHLLKSTERLSFVNVPVEVCMRPTYRWSYELPIFLIAF